MIAASRKRRWSSPSSRRRRCRWRRSWAPSSGGPGLVLHGETEVKKRKDWSAVPGRRERPFFVLSLKAGGTGLNLTAASHVIHFDRWWNPAVENQATDRAFRIGQKRNVLVHKFVCRGTVEDKIDEMIESKQQLAGDLLDGGADMMLTEMKDAELLKLVALDLGAAMKEGSSMSYYEWRPYVPVAGSGGRRSGSWPSSRSRGTISPVTIEGRKIAKSFWGKSWCDNLERYSDYANRLPRGRTYVRNGSVVDLQDHQGEVAAKVAAPSSTGQDRHRAGDRGALASDLPGLRRPIDSLVELLQGRLAKGVMDRVCRKGDGLFPSPREIKLSCSCPDWADMCKHVAAVLYGVGARLDQEPGCCSCCAAWTSRT